MATPRPRGRPPHADVLTPAEWRVVEAVRHGMTNPQIARRQGVSLDAVKYHMANALQKLGLPSRAELRRWDGVRGDSPLKTRRKTAVPTETLGLGPLAQIGRHVADIDAAQAWYAQVLGLELLYAFPGMAFFRLGDARLYLQQSEKPAGESILYFRVEDIHAVHEALTKRGAGFVNAPHIVHRHPDGTEEWMAELRDGEGQPLAIMAQVRPATDV